MAIVVTTVSGQLLSAMLHCSTLHFENLDPELENEESEGISRDSVCTDVLYLTLYTKVCIDVLYLTLYTKVCTDVLYLTLHTKVRNSICSCNTYLPLHLSVTFE
jgi:hypothetical protein